MREIKFRAWDSEQMRVMDKMYVGVGQIGLSDEHYVDLNEMDHEAVELMQYTGLKDKNSVDIYEGDILRYEDRNPPLRWITFDRGSFRSASRQGSTTSLYQIWHLEADDPSFVKAEVIGNIYENPELFKPRSA